MGRLSLEMSKLNCPEVWELVGIRAKKGRGGFPAGATRYHSRDGGHWYCLYNLWHPLKDLGWANHWGECLFLWIFLELEVLYWGIITIRKIPKWANQSDPVDPSKHCSSTSPSTEGIARMWFTPALVGAHRAVLFLTLCFCLGESLTTLPTCLNHSSLEMRFCLDDLWCGKRGPPPFHQSTQPTPPGKSEAAGDVFGPARWCPWGKKARCDITGTGGRELTWGTHPLSIQLRQPLCWARHGLLLQNTGWGFLDLPLFFFFLKDTKNRGFE